jgi:hypothetical protein
VEGRNEPMNYFLDTHVVVWLYQKSLKLLSPKAIQVIEDNSISISPIVLLELEYLYEIGKIKTDSHTILKYLNKKIGLKLGACPRTPGEHKVHPYLRPETFVGANNYSPLPSPISRISMIRTGS